MACATAPSINITINAIIYQILPDKYRLIQYYIGAITSAASKPCLPVFSSFFLLLLTFNMVSLDDRIVIIGAGCFGVSTAYHLLKRGFLDVTILDRSNTIPAPDAASNDINRSQPFLNDSECLRLADFKRQLFAAHTQIHSTPSWPVKLSQCGKIRKSGAIHTKSACAFKVEIPNR